MSRLIDADAIYPWYMDAFDFDPNEVRFSMNDIRDNLDNIPTHPTPSNTLGALDCVSREDLTKGIETYFGDLPIAVHYDMLALAQRLPSVQPEIIRCKYCKHWNNAPTSDGYNSCEKDALIRHESFFCADAKLRGEQE